MDVIILHLCQKLDCHQAQEESIQAFSIQATIYSRASIKITGQTLLRLQICCYLQID